MRVDIQKGWRQYTKLMERETDPRARARLHNMRLHHKYECLVDPAIFDTMVPEPEYQFFDGRGKTTLNGMKEVQAFYHGNWDSGASLVDLEIEHCATADWGVACDSRRKKTAIAPPNKAVRCKPPHERKSGGA